MSHDRSIENVASNVDPYFNVAYDIDMIGRPEGDVYLYRRNKVQEDGSIVPIQLDEPATYGQIFSLYEWYHVDPEATTANEFSHWRWIADSWQEEFIRINAFISAGTDNSLKSK